MDFRENGQVSIMGYPFEAYKGVYFNKYSQTVLSIISNPIFKQTIERQNPNYLLVIYDSNVDKSMLNKTKKVNEIHILHNLIKNRYEISIDAYLFDIANASEKHKDSIKYLLEEPLIDAYCSLVLDSKTIYKGDYKDIDLDTILGFKEEDYERNSA